MNPFFTNSKQQGDRTFTLLTLSTFIRNVEKWSNILLKSCGVNTARFVKYVWPFFKIIYEKNNSSNPQKLSQTTQI